MQEVRIIAADDELIGLIRGEKHAGHSVAADAALQSRHPSGDLRGAGSTSQDGGVKSSHVGSVVRMGGLELGRGDKRTRYIHFTGARDHRIDPGGAPGRIGAALQERRVQPIDFKTPVLGRVPDGIHDLGAGGAILHHLDPTNQTRRLGGTAQHMAV